MRDLPVIRCRCTGPRPHIGLEHSKGGKQTDDGAASQLQQRSEPVIRPGAASSAPYEREEPLPRLAQGVAGGRQRAVAVGQTPGIGSSQRVPHCRTHEQRATQNAYLTELRRGYLKKIKISQYS